ncbi:MAG: FkbM family methyltransferase [Rhizomicrobium sp.]
MSVLSGKRSLRTAFKRILWNCGYEIRDRRFSAHPTALALQLIARTYPDIIVDVGANAGQYASEILQFKPDARIISFEPLAAAHATATAESRKYRNWTVRERVAVGAETRKSRINVSKNSVSSSLLNMTEVHLRAEPLSQFIGVEEVAIQPLDALLIDVPRSKRLYLKIDTQGYERQVLDGSSRLLSQVVALQLELSFERLCDGQMLAWELVQFVQQNGFKPFGFANGFREIATGELLQMDGYFLR